MQVYKHKIRIKKFIGSIDSNNDGVLDSLKLVSKDVYVPVILKQTIQDLGINTDEPEPIEIIDLTSFWDTTNNGSGDSEEIFEIGDIVDDYQDEEVTIQLNTTGTVTIIGCMDTKALNFSPSANTPCSGCCDYGQGGDSFDGGGGGSFDATAINYHRISYGVCDKSTFNDAKSSLRDEARRWCRSTASRCNSNPYPTENNCVGNGCGRSYVCCPGPKDTWQLLEKCPKDVNCKGKACDTDKIFTDIIDINGGPTGSSQNSACGCKKWEGDKCVEYYRLYNYTFEFYCIKK
jgi:hypothetical protein